jgi:hypothetical protein
MKKQYFLPLCLMLSVFVLINNTRADERGMALFIGACRALDRSHPLIDSISLQIDRSVSFPMPSEKLIQERAKSIQANHQEYIKQISDPETKARMEKMLSIEKTIAAVRYGLENGNKARLHILILNDKNDIKMKIDISEYDFGTKKWGQNSTVLNENHIPPSHPKFPSMFLRWYADQHEAFLSNEGSPEFGCRLLGRVQGYYADTLYVRCPFESRDKTIEFIENEIGSPQIVNDSVSYEDGGKASKIELRKNGKLVMGLLVDASKGYVCPLIQVFHSQTGNLQDEYISHNYFLHQKTGLWFPAVCIQKSYDVQTGKLTTTTENRIDSRTLLVNEAVSPNEFSVDIVEDAIVHDEAHGKSRRYRAVENGVLSLVKGGLDVDKMSWLREDLEQDIPRHGGASGIIRVILILTGIVLILISLIFKLWNKKKNILPLFSLLLFLGCGRPVPLPDTLIVQPSVIDFGKIRATDPPVQTQFTLRNNGTKPVTILDIASGCGCTVVEPPQKVILVDEEIIVPVKINVWGRYGNFKNSVRIKTDVHPDTIQLAITGNVVTDIWLSSQSIRCTAASGQSAMSVFELHTVDYPNVAFDFSRIDDSIEIEELSRTTEDGETIIKYNVVVEMREYDIVTRSLLLIPTDPNITPLTVPVYCYREDEPVTPPVLQTQSIALGTVYADETHEVSVYGDSDLIGVIKQAIFQGDPSDINVQVLVSEKMNTLRLAFQFPDTDDAKMIEGKIKFVTAGKRELTIPVFGLLCKRDGH